MLRGRGSVSDRHKRKGNSWSRIIFVPWQLSHDAGYTIKERLCLKNTGIWWVIFFILFLVNQSGRQCTDRSKVRIQEDSLIHTICSMEFDLRIVGVGRGGILSVSGKKWIPWNYTALLILLQITTLAINYNVQQNIPDPANRQWFLDPVSAGCNLNMGFVIQYHHHHWKQRPNIRIDKIEITAGGRHQLRWSDNRQRT